MSYTKPNKLKLLLFLPCFFLWGNVVGQQAVITEVQQVFRTYPFADPNPVVSMAGRLKRIYPYFSFNGYSARGKDQAWKIVRLENPYIRVDVTPDIGGKVWGAIEKSTDNTFIYYNNVVKFRDIAMRGPWTSGGIEFNFGTIGHTPTTSTPVDYVLCENGDGSVSCIVGALELASRTEWRVEIRLPADKAYFETRSFWYNPTPLNTSLYHWMNAAAIGRDDLHLNFPGHNYIGHGGEAHPWPIDEKGRNINIYGENNFGPNKSYHILGEYSEFFGGNWRNDDFGFGHWTLGSEKPGKKIWIWSLSRQGQIWADLLTDKDKGGGQYIEMQTGLLFNQAGTTSSLTPFKHVFFAPNGVERFSEIWFPFKKIGGLAAATPYGSMNVTREKNGLKIAICPLQDIDDELLVTVDEKRIYTKHLILKPMEVFVASVDLTAEGKIVVTVGDNKIRYSIADNETKKLHRPLTANKDFDWTSVYGLYTEAVELAKQRDYKGSLAKYLVCLDKDPAYGPALTGVAEHCYRRMEYQKGLDYAAKALANNAYDPAANFVYGILNRQLGNLIDAADGFGFAARSLEYRSAANTQLAEIYFLEQNFGRVEKHAHDSLDYNKYNLNAYKLLAVIYRKQNKKREAKVVLAKLAALDPLNHFARFEQYLLTPNQEHLRLFTAMIRNELPQETYLELAIGYANLGLNMEAIRVLENAPSHPMVSYWLAYLYQEENSPEKSRVTLAQASQKSPWLCFPFRRETIRVLEWADRKKETWQPAYYLGLIYWGKGRMEAARNLFTQCGNTPDFAPFYLTRGNLFKGESSEKVLLDYHKALRLGKKKWRAYHLLINHYNEIAWYGKALAVSAKAYQDYADEHFIIGIDHAKTLLFNRKYDECVTVIDDVNILPYEGAREGHDIYRQANLLHAVDLWEKEDYKKALKSVKKSLAWPEHLGVGSPYFPDVRLENYIEALCHEQLGNKIEAAKLYERIYKFTLENWTKWGAYHYVSAVVLRKMGRNNQAEQLLRDWEEAQPPDDMVVKWSVAKFNKKSIKAREALAGKKNKTHGTPWNPAGSDNDFPLVLEAMKTIEKQER